MSVLVLGAGMVGAHIVEELKTRGQEVLLVDVYFDDRYIASICGDDGYSRRQGTVTDPYFVRDILEEFGVTRVINGAAILPMRVGHTAHPGFFEVNAWGGANVMFAAKAHGVERLIHMSTNGVYRFRDNHVDGPVGEDFPTGLTFGNSYGNTKAVVEFLAHELLVEGGFEVSVVRPGEIFGTMVPRSGDGEVFWQRMVEAAMSDRKLIVSGEPEHRLDWIYCKDVARFVVDLTLKDGPVAPAYNVSMGAIMGIYDWMESLDRLFPNHQVSLDSCGRSGWNYPLDTRLARQDVAFEPLFSLDSGIRDYVSWRRNW